MKKVVWKEYLIQKYIVSYVDLSLWDRKYYFEYLTIKYAG